MKIWIFQKENVKVTVYANYMLEAVKDANDELKRKGFEISIYDSDLIHSDIRFYDYDMTKIEIL